MGHQVGWVDKRKKKVDGVFDLCLIIRAENSKDLLDLY